LNNNVFRRENTPPPFSQCRSRGIAGGVNSAYRGRAKSVSVSFRFVPALILVCIAERIPGLSLAPRPRRGLGKADVPGIMPARVFNFQGAFNDNHYFE
jgi:hypothetical protein